MGKKTWTYSKSTWKEYVCIKNNITIDNNLFISFYWRVGSDFSLNIQIQSFSFNIFIDQAYNEKLMFQMYCIPLAFSYLGWIPFFKGRIRIRNPDFCSNRTRAQVSTHRGRKGYLSTWLDGKWFLRAKGNIYIGT